MPSNLCRQIIFVRGDFRCAERNDPSYSGLPLSMASTTTCCHYICALTKLSNSQMSNDANEVVRLPVESVYLCRFAERITYRLAG